MCFNYSEADATKENWNRYYWEAIKKTFCFGSFIVWCHLWFLPLQSLQAYSTVFIIASETIGSFVSCRSFTWVNVKTRELVIIELDRFAFQQAEASLSASTLHCSSFRLSRTAWTEFHFVGNFVNLWLYCNFTFVIGLMMKLKRDPHSSFVHSFHPTFIVSSGTALHNVKSNCRKSHLLQYVCVYSAGVVVCIFVHEYMNQQAFTLKFPYSFPSSVGRSIRLSLIFLLGTLDCIVLVTGHSSLNWTQFWLCHGGHWCPIPHASVLLWPVWSGISVSFWGLFWNFVRMAWGSVGICRVRWRVSSVDSTVKPLF